MLRKRLRHVLAIMVEPASAASCAAARRYAACSTAQREADVVIALGSNMGNRGLNLHRGLRRLRDLGVQILRHSALYETAAAYVTDQPSFLNGAVLARTTLPPLELLRLLKQVETEAGRDLEGGRRFGPRPLDLDIVFFGAAPFRHEQLEVPHPRWHERPFVQAPVADLLYRRDAAAASSTECSQSGSSSRNSGRGGAYSREPLPAGNLGSVLGHLRAVRRHWDAVRWGAADGAGGENKRGGGGGGSTATTSPGAVAAAAAGGEVMRRVTPLVNMPPQLPSSSPARTTALADTLSYGGGGGSTAGGSGTAAATPADAVLCWGGRTHLMAILNVTPDSFSDGGMYDSSVAAAVSAAERMAAEGADLIDVGGQSTRPGATQLSVGEELGRVMPVLRALRQSSRLRGLPLSIDTFHSAVAQVAVAEGEANIVNDVSGGAADPFMTSTVADLGVPYILMHMRGDPCTMTSRQHTSYGSVWREVGTELQAGAEAAEAAGVAAWNIILDPGIGFAKTAEGNVELLRHLAQLRTHALDGPYAAATPYDHDPYRPTTGYGAVCAASGSGGGGGPMLVGPSRKRFLGSLTGRERPEERDAATAAACVVAVGAGADMVRVHAVAGVRDALRVADAVYRGGGASQGR